MEGSVQGPSEGAVHGERGHRRLVVVRGTRAETRDAAAGRLHTEDVLWISAVDGRTPRQARQDLGRSLDVVVLDLHDGLDADALGVAAGLVRGGGALVLRLPPPGNPPGPDARFTVHGHPTSAIGRRAWARLERWLRGVEVWPGAVGPAPHITRGTPEQAALVDVLAARWAGGGPSTSVVLAARGRGKSAALGLAIARLPADQRVVLTAGSRAAAETATRFAGRAVFRPLDAVLSDPEPCSVLVVDEAARLPVPTLQALVAAHPGVHLAFATTSEGYEGTGRGFVLRFLAWLRRRGALAEHRLQAPIRWSAGCPLERDVGSLLALDAAPAAVAPTASTPVHRVLDRDALARDEDRLRQVFGLLVHAHYRTTPADLVRMLDGPNLSVHVLEVDGHVVAVNLLAEEGGLPAGLVDDAARGRLRLRGQALADTLLTHGGRPEAGPLRMVRSVRIAVHPAWRRRGLGRVLADAVHETRAPDLFGTLFGATPEILAFRRAQGYRLVRVGGARGDRTGEPAAVMVRPVSPVSHALVEGLRMDLARDLPHQLAWLRAEAPLDPALAAALQVGLPAAAPLCAGATRAALAGYLDGPRTSDSVAAALAALFARPAPPGVSPPDRALLAARFEDHAGWRVVAAAGGQPGVRAAQRRLKVLARTWLAHDSSPPGAER